MAVCPGGVYEFNNTVEFGDFLFFCGKWSCLNPRRQGGACVNRIVDTKISLQVAQTVVPLFHRVLFSRKGSVGGVHLEPVAVCTVGNSIVVAKKSVDTQLVVGIDIRGPRQ